MFNSFQERFFEAWTAEQPDCDVFRQFQEFAKDSKQHQLFSTEFQKIFSKAVNLEKKEVRIYPRFGCGLLIDWPSGCSKGEKSDVDLTLIAPASYEDNTRSNTEAERASPRFSIVHCRYDLIPLSTWKKTTAVEIFSKVEKLIDVVMKTRNSSESVTKYWLQAIVEKANELRTGGGGQEEAALQPTNDEASKCTDDIKAKVEMSGWCPSWVFVPKWGGVSKEVVFFAVAACTLCHYMKMEPQYSIEFLPFIKDDSELMQCVFAAIGLWAIKKFQKLPDVISLQEIVGLISSSSLFKAGEEKLQRVLQLSSVLNVAKRIQIESVTCQAGTTQKGNSTAIGHFSDKSLEMAFTCNVPPDATTITNSSKSATEKTGQDSKACDSSGVGQHGDADKTVSDYKMKDDDTINAKFDQSYFPISQLLKWKHRLESHAASSNSTAPKSVSLLSWNISKKSIKPFLEVFPVAISGVHRYTAYFFQEVARGTTEDDMLSSGNFRDRSIWSAIRHGHIGVIYNKQRCVRCDVGKFNSYNKDGFDSILLDIDSNILAACVYWPPENNQLRSEGYDAFERLQKDVHILFGDLNARHKQWDASLGRKGGTADYPGEARGRFILEKITAQHGAKVYPTSPNISFEQPADSSQNSCPDIAVSKIANTKWRRECSLKPQQGRVNRSDHYPVELELIFDEESSSAGVDRRMLRHFEECIFGLAVRELHPRTNLVEEISKIPNFMSQLHQLYERVINSNQSLILQSQYESHRELSMQILTTIAYLLLVKHHESGGPGSSRKFADALKKYRIFDSNFLSQHFSSLSKLARDACRSLQKFLDSLASAAPFLFDPRKKKVSGESWSFFAKIAFDETSCFSVSEKVEDMKKKEKEEKAKLIEEIKNHLVELKDLDDKVSRDEKTYQETSCNCCSEYECKSWCDRTKAFQQWVRSKANYEKEKRKPFGTLFGFPREDEAKKLFAFLKEVNITSNDTSGSQKQSKLHSFITCSQRTWKTTTQFSGSNFQVCGVGDVSVFSTQSAIPTITVVGESEIIDTKLFAYVENDPFVTTAFLPPSEPFSPALPKEEKQKWIALPPSPSPSEALLRGNKSYSVKVFQQGMEADTAAMVAGIRVANSLQLPGVINFLLSPRAPLHSCEITRKTLQATVAHLAALDNWKANTVASNTFQKSLARLNAREGEENANSFVGNHLTIIGSMLALLSRESFWCIDSFLDLIGQACLQQYKEIDQIGEPSHHIRLATKGKQAVICAGGICCFAARPAYTWTKKTLTIYLTLLFKWRHAATSASSEIATDALRRQIQPVLDDAIFSTSSEVQKALLNPGTNQQEALSQSIMDLGDHSEIDGVGWVPNDAFKWKSIKGNFEIDLATGIVLKDGFPLCGLPLKIRNDPVFSQIFGEDCDFEVQRKVDDRGITWFTTTHNLAGMLNFPQPIRFSFGVSSSSASSQSGVFIEMITKENGNSPLHSEKRWGIFRHVEFSRKLPAQFQFNTAKDPCLAFRYQDVVIVRHSQANRLRVAEAVLSLSPPRNGETVTSCKVVPVELKEGRTIEEILETSQPPDIPTSDVVTAVTTTTTTTQQSPRRNRTAFRHLIFLPYPKDNSQIRLLCDEDQRTGTKKFESESFISLQVVKVDQPATSCSIVVHRYNNLEFTYRKPSTASSSSSWGLFECSHAQGYALSDTTKLSTFLPFAGIRAVVLEKMDLNPNPSDHKIKLLLSTTMDEDLSLDVNTKLSYYEYFLHDHIQELRPVKNSYSREAALHLALVYSRDASGRLLLGMQKTSIECAIQILRRCFSNIPLSDAEHQILRKLSNTAAKSSSLLLLVELLFRFTSSGTQSSQESPASPVTSNRCIKALTQLQAKLSHSSLSYRQTLKLCECEILHAPTANAAFGLMQSITELHQSEAEKFVIQSDQKQKEEMLARETHVDQQQQKSSEDGNHLLLMKETKTQLLSFHDEAEKFFADESKFNEDVENISSCPQSENDTQSVLKHRAKDFGKGKILQDMLTDVETSFKALENCKVMNSQKLGEKLPMLKGRAENLLQQSQNLVERMENLLLSDGSSSPSAFSFILELRRRFFLSPRLSKGDFVSLASDADFAEDFLAHVVAPYTLTKELRALTRDCVIHWMQIKTINDYFLCFLDWCKKVGEVVEGGETPPPRMAKSSTRAEIRKHPYWCAFEVEMRLRIREEQHQMALDLQKNYQDDKGTVLQLNMGEGKTQVITPLIILHARYGLSAVGNNKKKNEGGKLIRICFLRSLIDEGKINYFNFLSLTGFGLQLLEAPFQRDTPIDDWFECRMKFISWASAHAFLLITREDRLSLIQKRRELQLVGNQDAIDILDRTHRGVMQKFRQETPLQPMRRVSGFRTVFDEVDELMSPQWSLVYAVGDNHGLKDADIRFEIIPFLLRLIRETKVESGADKIAIFDDHLGSDRFPTILFFGEDEMPSGSISLIGEWKSYLVYKLRDMGEGYSVPHALEFLQDQQDDRSNKKVILNDKEWKVVKKFILGFCDLKDVKNVVRRKLNKNNYRTLMLLRGLFSSDVLWHSLTNRVNVRFGVPNQKHIKRIAVPYEATDTPSTRSEFAHPDVALILTFLAYYNRGLTREEFNEAIRKLLKANPDERRDVFDQCRNSIQSEEVKENLTCKNSDNINYEFPQQQQELFEAFRFNTYFIDFWLKKAVFPQDTTQYPRNLTAAANELVAEEETAMDIMGFSGTKDTLVPPTRLCLRPGGGDVVQATDAHMIQLIHSHSQVVPPLRTSEHENGNVWQFFLECAVERKCTAVLDVGSLLAGQDLVSVAKWLNNQGGFSDLRKEKKMDGITFVSNVTKLWMVFDCASGAILHRGERIQDKECFAIYDEAHCRGSDLKLDINTHALLSLGPGLTKARLMQAAGRLRNFGRGQTLSIFATQTIRKAIQDLFPLRNQQNYEVDIPQIILWSLLNSGIAVRDLKVMWQRQLDLFSKHCTAEGTPPTESFPTDVKSLYHVVQLKNTDLNAEVQREVQVQVEVKIEIENEFPCEEPQPEFNENIITTMDKLRSICQEKLEKRGKGFISPQSSGNQHELPMPENCAMSDNFHASPVPSRTRLIEFVLLTRENFVLLLTPNELHKHNREVSLLQQGAVMHWSKLPDVLERTRAWMAWFNGEVTYSPLDYEQVLRLLVSKMKAEALSNDDVEMCAKAMLEKRKAVFRYNGSQLNKIVEGIKHTTSWQQTVEALPVIHDLSCSSSASGMFFDGHLAFVTGSNDIAVYPKELLQSATDLKYADTPCVRNLTAQAEAESEKELKREKYCWIQQHPTDSHLCALTVKYATREGHVIKLALAQISEDKFHIVHQIVVLDAVEVNEVMWSPTGKYIAVGYDTTIKKNEPKTIVFSVQSKSGFVFREKSPLKHMLPAAFLRHQDSHHECLAMFATATSCYNFFDLDADGTLLSSFPKSKGITIAASSVDHWLLCAVEAHGDGSEEENRMGDVSLVFLPIEAPSSADCVIKNVWRMKRQCLDTNLSCSSVSPSKMSVVSNYTATKLLCVAVSSAQFIIVLSITANTSKWHQVQSFALPSGCSCSLLLLNNEMVLHAFVIDKETEDNEEGKGKEPEEKEAKEKQGEEQPLTQIHRYKLESLLAKMATTANTTRPVSGSSSFVSASPATTTTTQPMVATAAPCFGQLQGGMEQGGMQQGGFGQQQGGFGQRGGMGMGGGMQGCGFGQQQQGNKKKAVIRRS